MLSFQFHALDGAQFAPLFHFSERDLSQRLARKIVVEAHPGAPCRVSLEDAEVGETVLLLNYEHQVADSPYRSCHAIYVREGVAQARPAQGVVPEMFRTRLLSLRGFSVEAMIVAAEVVNGDSVGIALTKMFRNQVVAEIHVHFAKPGCFGARVTRGD